MNPKELICSFAFAMAFLPTVALGDRLQLSNGDEIEGKLLEMSGDVIKFRHPNLGDFSVPRHQVHAIELGNERGGKRVLENGEQADSETPEEIVDRLVNPDLNRDAVKKLEKNARKHPTPEDVVEQLRRDGPSGQALQGYFGILDGFIEESDPGKPLTVPGVPSATPSPIPPQQIK